MRTVEVIASPALIPHYDIDGKILVVIDILRATSSMVVGLAHGAKGIIPVETVEECLRYRKMGYICAAERNGMVVDGFDMGNSPFSYMEDRVKNTMIAMTTTNGTLAIKQSARAAEIVIGAFLNLSALVEWLNTKKESVILLCSGWKNRINLEDTLFAGAMVHLLRETHKPDCDAALLAEKLYIDSNGDLHGIVMQSSHAHRFQALGIEQDIELCLKTNLYPIVPILKQGVLIAEKEVQQQVL